MAGRRCYRDPIAGQYLASRHIPGGPYQNLAARELIVPFLAITIESSLSEDFDVLPAPDPKGNRLLERVVEVVRLPVGDVVGKLLVLGLVTQMCALVNTYLDFSFQLNLNIIQEAQIQFLSNHVSLAFLQQ